MFFSLNAKFNNKSVLWIRIRIHFNRLDPDPHWESVYALMVFKVFLKLFTTGYGTVPYTIIFYLLL
jgi:hypothetical protein